MPCAAIVVSGYTRVPVYIPQFGFLNQTCTAFGRALLVFWNCFGSRIGVSVCLPPRALITSGMIWCDIGRVWLVKQVSRVFPVFNYFIPYNRNHPRKKSFANCFLCHNSRESFCDSGNLIYKSSGQNKKCKKTFANSPKFAKLFFRESFLLYGMTLALDRMDGRGHINTARHERLPKKTKVMWY